ncbi:MAG: DUF3488 domain-containing transglutaminase family protein [Bdellovibrionales bacterium]|nr:DUF3488 domain-containing transglutaminase family protein [Bdellovibrionales bacterium]
MSEKGLKHLTLPLILLVGINVLPSIYLRPLWSVIFCSVLLGYRLWLHLIDAKMPPRPLMVVIQLTVAVAIWQHYTSFFGDEAAGTFLTLLTCLKVYELRAKRDYFITVVLCFLVLMSALLLDQTLVMTLFLLADLILLTTYMFALEEEAWRWKGWKTSLRPALVLTAKALPLMAVIFILFPRFSTGFGTGPNVQAKTGVTDSLKPGSVSNLIDSDELVFRATFLDGMMPPRQSLYWRGAVLDTVDGLDWTRSQNDTRLRPRPIGDPGEIEVYLEMGFEKFLFSLDDTATLDFPKGTRLTQRDGRIFELDQPLQSRQRYYIHAAEERPTEIIDEERYLQMADKPSEKMRELITKLRQPTTAGSVRAIQQRFNDGGFAYSMQPPPVSSVDEFLFKTRTGFCEHYAGTMATLLRHMDIPARVVVGFQGGTPSFLDNYITVRAQDAHAWVEYYDRGTRRWLRVDPTAQVDPLRISEGSQSYLKENVSWIPKSILKLFENGRTVFDEIDASWSGFLLRFDLAKQKELLEKLGMEGVLYRALPVFLILAIVLILAVLYYFEAQRREPVSPEESLYRLFLRRLKGWRLEKRANEGPMDLLKRIESANPEFGAEVRPILDELIQVRFAGRKLEARRHNALRSAIKKLRYR